MSNDTSDRVRYFAARAIDHLPDRLKVRLSGEAAVVVDGQQLDPQVQVLRSVRRRIKRHGLVEPTIEAGRARYRRETRNFRGPVTEVASVRDFTIANGLRVRHYAPAAADAPLTVYLHGGGWVIGDLDTHDEPCRVLCREARTHVLSVDYRLAPEHPFPAALEDALAAFAWARENAATLGADPRRVAMGGDSAGANLSAVVSQMTRDSHPPAAQLLIYPPTDTHTPRPAHVLFSEGFFLDGKDRDAFEQYYLGGQTLDGDPRVSPLRATDLSRLPPALVVTAGFDILRDDGEAYAAALSAAGTRASIQRYPGLGHGFIHMTGVCRSAREAMFSIAREWRTMLSA
jgi:acetyl esterase